MGGGERTGGECDIQVSPESDPCEFPVRPGCHFLVYRVLFGDTIASLTLRGSGSRES